MTKQLGVGHKPTTYRVTSDETWCFTLVDVIQAFNQEPFEALLHPELNLNNVARFVEATQRETRCVSTPG